MKMKMKWKWIWKLFINCAQRQWRRAIQVCGRGNYNIICQRVWESVCVSECASECASECSSVICIESTFWLCWLSVSVGNFCQNLNKCCCCDCCCCCCCDCCCCCCLPLRICELLELLLLLSVTRVYISCLSWHYLLSLLPRPTPYSQLPNYPCFCLLLCLIISKFRCAWHKSRA